jgi:hypothetical protein
LYLAVTTMTDRINSSPGKQNSEKREAVINFSLGDPSLSKEIHGIANPGPNMLLLRMNYFSIC